MRILPVIAAAFCLIGAGVIHGIHTDRWGAKADLAGAAARLDNVPMTEGDWEGQPMEMDARQLAVAEAAGCLARHYTNRRTGAETSVVVLCGRPGPIAVHSPEVCYPGSGFAKTGESEICPLDGGEAPPAAQLLKAKFVKPGAVPETLDVFWAYKADGPWAATANPRVTYARSSILYKIYVIRRLSDSNEKSGQDPCLDFLRAFLPELDKSVSPSA